MIPAVDSYALIGSGPISMSALWGPIMLIINEHFHGQGEITLNKQGKQSLIKGKVIVEFI